jgi:hypothetical protein
MAKTKTSWTPGQSGNPKGRLPGTGRIEEYRGLLDPHVPDLLKVLVTKAKEGDLAAQRLILERVFPVHSTAMADILGEIDELRSLLQKRNETTNKIGAAQ